MPLDEPIYENRMHFWKIRTDNWFVRLHQLRFDYSNDLNCTVIEHIVLSTIHVYK